MGIVNVSAIKAESARWKPGGYYFDKSSAELAQLWEDCSSGMTYSYLQALGLGNKKQTRPFQAALTRRIVDALTVVYSVPAVRRLRIAGEDLEDDTAGQLALVEAFERSTYDLLWQGIDTARNLFRTVAVEWREDPGERAVSAYVFAPHQIHRVPDPDAPTELARDKQILLTTRISADPRDNLYRAWIPSKGGWSVYLVNEAGDEVGRPYGGVSPFREVLPLHLVHDEHPLGAAWLPIPESRVQWALGVNGALNDLNYLVQLEAHTIKSIKSSRRSGLPTEVGPDMVLGIDQDAEFQVHPQNPKIEEAVKALEQLLSLWALSEFLPPDEFTPSSQPLTSAALKMKERALAKRRWRQIQLVPAQESAAWLRYARIHNTFCRSWGLDPLPEGAELRVTVGRTWQPVDQAELQNYLFRLLAAGFKSRVDVMMELEGMTRHQAIDQLERVRRDNTRFPLTEFQNPAALVETRNAGGEGSATKTPGMFNPDLNTSTEGASVTDAAIAATS